MKIKTIRTSGNKMRLYRLLLPLIAIQLWAVVALAQESATPFSPPQGYTGSAEQVGLAIMKEVKSRDTGWGDSSSDMLMILRNRQGQESLREMRFKTLEVVGDGDKALTVFDKPRDVTGTAFLSFSHILEPDDQWLYLPALKRVKRIASKNKSGPFMGSEFSFEDLSSFEVEKYAYKYLREEALDGQDCYLVESYPVDKYSGYTRLNAWIDKAEYRPQKIEYYDRKKSLLKTQTFENYHLHLDKFWRANNMEMVNHQNGKSTRIESQNLKFQVGLKDSDFNQNTLKRAR